MKRLPRSVALSLLLILAAAAAFAAPGPVTERLADNVYAYIGGEGTTNSGFVITGKGVILIDSQGPRERAKALKASIREKTGKPVIYIINTHYHGDHTFGNQYFTGTVVSHEETRRLLISEDVPHRKRFKKFFGEDSLKGFRLTLPELTFDERLDLYANGSAISLIHPGIAHTRGDAYVYLPAEQIVFTGDILYKRRLPLLGEGSIKGVIHTLNEILSLRATVFVPGHGGLATRKDVLEYRQYLTDLMAEVKRLKASGKTKQEVSAEITLPAYKDYLKYNEWLPQNAAAAYRELAERKKVRWKQIHEQRHNTRGQEPHKDL